MGSAAFAQVADGTNWERAIPAVFAVSSAIALVLRITDKAAVPYDMYKRFIRLERTFLDSPSSSVETLNSLEHELREIETDEPSIYSALNRQCHNEVLRSEGLYSELQPLRWYHLALKNFRDFDNLPIRNRSAEIWEAAEKG